MQMPTGLSTRRRRAELLDQPGLGDDEHRGALDALGRINRLSGTAGAFWPWVRDECRRRRDSGEASPLRLLDFATGGGDLPVALWKRARREGLSLETAGCDRSPLAVERARALARAERADATFFTHDAIAEPIPAGYHVLASSLFLHHLEEPEALGFLRALISAGALVLIDDLRRGAAGWTVAYLGTRLLSRSRVAQVDGPISVEGAFTCEEALALARRAGWHDVQLRPHWPFRYLMIGRRS
jgi:2-polyprenyl-3-methyl-5-hydroxy-6-metoxy-1,4-benzoquinol methylase